LPANPLDGGWRSLESAFGTSESKLEYYDKISLLNPTYVLHSFRVILEISAKHVSARIVHFEGLSPVVASTREWAIKKYLYRYADADADADADYYSYNKNSLENTQKEF
jgi:hypothetical protein